MLDELNAAFLTVLLGHLRITHTHTHTHTIRHERTQLVNYVMLDGIARRQRSALFLLKLLMFQSPFGRCRMN